MLLKIDAPKVGSIALIFVGIFLRSYLMISNLIMFRQGIWQGSQMLYFRLLKQTNGKLMKRDAELDHQLMFSLNFSST